MRIPHNEPLGSDSSETHSAEATSPERATAPGSARADPERKCVLTGENGGRDEFVRLAISPDGLVLPDPLAKAPGRGAWIGVNRAALEQAQAKGKLRGALARAFKGAVLTIPEDLGALTQDALTRSLLQRLGLEMRSGKLMLGTDRIAEKARGGAIAWLGHASDAGEDGCRKLDQAWRVGRDEEGSGKAGMRLPLDRAALSMALGRENVVHLALADRASAERVAIPLQRLLRFTGPVTGPVSGADKPVGERLAQGAGPEAVTTHREY